MRNLISRVLIAILRMAFTREQRGILAFVLVPLFVLSFIAAMISVVWATYPATRMHELFALFFPAMLLTTLLMFLMERWTAHNSR